jgi:hypothetical protein
MADEASKMQSLKRIRVPAIYCLLLLTACESPTEPSQLLPDVRSWVVGAAAQTLDQSGHFLLPSPVAPGVRPITSTATAITLAQTFLREFRSPDVVTIGDASIRDGLNRERGAPIAFSSLAPAGWAYFAESPYQPISDTLPSYLHKYLGPHFLVPFLDGQDPAVVIASSAYNTDLAVEAGHLVFPKQSGNDFRSAGIPLHSGYQYPITPEHAVEVAWKFNGTRVNRVPTLVGPGRQFFPHFARWRVSLEHPVRVRGAESGREQETSELYVSGRISYGQNGGAVVEDQVEIATDQQPQRDTVQYFSSSRPDEPRSFVVELRPGFPTRFESVRVVGS